jgi:hypothetical protein
VLSMEEFALRLFKDTCFEGWIRLALYDRGLDG